MGWAMSEKAYVYALIRKDISAEQQIVQTAHATLEAGFRFQMPKSVANLIVLEIADEPALRMASDKLMMLGIDHHMFFEPDNNMGFSAIATRPITEKRERNIFSKWKLFMQKSCSCSVSKGEVQIEKFVSSQQQLPREFQHVIDKNFWELLEN